MPQVLTIMILDSNLYFTKGLELLLTHYFERKGLATRYVTSAHPPQSADLIFQSIEKNDYTQIFRYTRTRSKSAAITVQKRSNGLRYPSSSPKCLCCIGIVHRYADRKSLLLEVERVWEQKNQLKALPPPQVLTVRERQILSYIQKAKGLSQVARVLSLSPKTVSSHKRKAMAKLGFRRNNELYSWLRHGGLNSENNTMEY